MSHRLTGFGAVGLVALALSSCVELCGQRLSLFHDQQRDELRVLIFYDGIYDRPGGARGAEQIPEFAAAGDILLLDWIGHLRREEVEKTAQDPERPETDRRLAQAILDQVRAEPVGHFRDGQGRIGAAQLVTIRKVSELLRLINARFSLWVADPGTQPGGDAWRRSTELWRAAARGGQHAWFRLEGHALLFRFPADAREMARLKAAGVGSFLVEAHRRLTHAEGEAATQPADTDQRRLQALLMPLCSAPWSYDETGGMVSVRLGDPGSPSTLRVDLGREYPANLEEAVVKAAPQNLDRALGRLLMGDTTLPPDEKLGWIAQWGPPEMQALGLLSWANAEEGSANRAEALAALEKWAGQWNRSVGAPAAPVGIPDAQERKQAWAKWVREMETWPVLPVPDHTAPQPGVDGPAVRPAPGPDRE